jgi:hypothetical protein
MTAAAAATDASSSSDEVPKSDMFDAFSLDSLFPFMDEGGILTLVEMVSVEMDNELP